MHTLENFVRVRRVDERTGESILLWIVDTETFPNRRTAKRENERGGGNVQEFDQRVDHELIQ